MLRIRTISFVDACAYVERLHRHHRKPQGHKFSVAVVDAAGEVRGVCIVGRPVARGNQDGLTLEVTRLATDGSKNACSMLYAAARRAGKEMGYARILTYVLDSEPGTTLKAAGWQLSHVTEGRSWDTPSRRRTDKHPTEDKRCYAAQLSN